MERHIHSVTGSRLPLERQQFFGVEFMDKRKITFYDIRLMHHLL